MTVSAFARLRGVSRVTVYTWCTRGYVVRDSADGLVQVAESVAKLDARPLANRGGWLGGTKPGGRGGYGVRLPREHPPQ